MAECCYQCGGFHAKSTAATCPPTTTAQPQDAARERAEGERDAYKRAKVENDDRFMRERDEARAELASARRDGQRAEQRVKELRGALNTVSPGIVCHNLHHEKRDRHESHEPCPVAARLEALVAQSAS